MYACKHTWKRKGKERKGFVRPVLLRGMSEAADQQSNPCMTVSSAGISDKYGRWIKGLSLLYLLSVPVSCPAVQWLRFSLLTASRTVCCHHCGRCKQFPAVWADAREFRSRLETTFKRGRNWTTYWKVLCGQFAALQDILWFLIVLYLPHMSPLLNIERLQRTCTLREPAHTNTAKIGALSFHEMPRIRS